MKKTMISLIIGLSISTNVYAVDFRIQVNPLHYATSINKVEYVSQLIQDDPKLASQMDKDGLTPIHVAIKSNSLSSLKEIYKEKINPNIRNSKKETPLVYAIKLNKPKTVEFLLSIGANPNIPDIDGNDAEFYAEKASKRIQNLIFPKKEEVIYHKEEVLEKDEIEKLVKEKTKSIKDEINKKINESKKALSEKFDDIQRDEDKNKIKMSVLAGTIQELRNELDLLKIENEEIKNIIGEQKEVISKYQEIIWENNKEIKNLKTAQEEFKRKQLMGIYSAEKSMPEVNPILSLNKEGVVINEKEDPNELMNIDGKYKEIEVIYEENPILEFNK